MKLVDELVFLKSCRTLAASTPPSAQPRENTFTQADFWDELRRNVFEAVTALHFDRTAFA
jgi:hypothetical protein